MNAKPALFEHAAAASCSRAGTAHATHLVQQEQRGLGGGPDGTLVPPPAVTAAVQRQRRRTSAPQQPPPLVLAT
eukprot:scaffold284052_cov21-Tisochrysis_lutea.AAC.1